MTSEATDPRFAFGENWSRFLRLLTPERIAEAEESLRQSLGVHDLAGRTFLDVGSGSGLFSLAARRLGASVHSFDYDRDSVACTASLKERNFPGDTEWTVEQGSALDTGYLERLPRFDIVYSWGVLHHTGRMWEALNNVVNRVPEGGTLFIALYNDQQWITRYWRRVKKLYNHARFARPLLIAFHAPYLVGARWLVRSMKGQRSGGRGMSLWYDMVDWLGGYPFEVATPDDVTRFLAERGFDAQTVKTCGRRHGCNEFVFKRARRVGN